MMSGSDSVRLPSSLRILWMANLWCLLLTHVWKKDVLRSPSKSHLVLVFCLQYVALYNSLCLSLALAACKFLGEPGHRIRQKSSSALVSLFVGPHLLEDVAESEETPASKGLPSSSQPEPKLGKAILVRHRLLCLTYASPTTAWKSSGPVQRSRKWKDLRALTTWGLIERRRGA